MSGLEVIGGISAVIAIIDASVKIWDRAQKDVKLPETFKIVARRLPLLLSTLQICHDRLEPIQDTLPPDIVESFRAVVQNSKAQARLLRDIFEETVPGEDAKRLERYRAAVKSVGKGKRLEQLLQSISEDTRVLAGYHSVQMAQPDPVPGLEQLIEELKDAQPSIDEETPSSSAFQNYNYGGQQDISTGHARHSGQVDQHVYGGVRAIHQYSGKLAFYGEGNNAIPRLQKEINKLYGADVATLWSTARQIRSLGLCLDSAPTIEPSEFVGRTIEIDAIHDLLRPKKAPRGQRRIVLGGIGGTGKTQLAIAYARQHQGSYTSVFWLNATSESTLRASLQLVFQAFIGTNELERLDYEQMLAGAREWLSYSDNTQWLLIFDNYDNPELFDIESVCPNTGHGSIVITTRLPDRVAGHPVRVQPLHDIDAGLAILQIRSGRQGVQEDIGAHRLVRRLDGLPLALATAGTYLRKSTLTFRQYLHLYEQRWQVDARRPLQLQDYQNRTLHTTWNTSYQRLKEDDPDAARMLQLLAYFDNQEVWYGLCHAGLSNQLPEWLQSFLIEQTNFESVMQTLVEYCLVEAQYASQSYSLHNCVHDWVLGELNREIDPQLYWYAFDCVAASIDRNDWGALGQVKYGRVSRHGVRLTHQRFIACDECKDGLSEHLDEVKWIAEMLTEQVQLLAAEQMYARALARQEKALGLNHISTLQTVDNIGTLYRYQDKLVESEQMYLRALAGQEKVLGPDHTHTLMTVNNLGILYCAQGKLNKAEQMYLRALAGQEKALGPDHTSTLNTVNNLGLLYRDQGKLDEAEQMYLRALAGKEKALGPDHTSTLQTVHNLGKLYRAKDQLQQAEQMYQRALVGYETALHFQAIPALNIIEDLSKLYASQEKWLETEQLCRRVLAGRLKVLGPSHPSTLSAIKDLRSLPQILPDEQDPLDDSASIVSTLVGSLQLNSALAEAARNELQRLFTDDQFSKSILQAVVVFSTLGTNGLFRVLTTVLGSFARDLRKEVNAPRGSLIREACKFLAGNATRLAYSIASAAYKKSGTPEDVFFSLHSQPSDVGSSQLLDRYLTGRGSSTAGATAPLSEVSKSEDRFVAPPNQDQNDESLNLDESEDDSTSEADEVDVPALGALRDVFGQSDAYTRMKGSLWHFTREHICDWSSIDLEWREQEKEPPPLYLRESSAKDIHISQEESSNLIDKFKLSLEAHTGQPWDWWPFEPPRKPILAGKVRLKWKCCCGEPQSADITKSLADRVKQFTSIAHDQRKGSLSQDPSNEWRLREQKVDSHIRERAPQSLPRGQSSGVTTAVTSMSSGGAQGRINFIGQGNSPGLTTSGPTISGPTTHHQPPPSTWILLCLENGTALDHEQIEIQPSMRDNEFFRNFRLQYRKLRGWSYWYSTDKFYYCHAAKFVKWDVRQLGYDCNQMPDDDSYIYQPRPPCSPYACPVLPREWEHRFHKACSYPSQEILSCLPKKVMRHELDTCRRREEIWGLYVVYRTSTTVVLVWLFILASPSTIFLALMLGRRPKMDLQDAVVPMVLTFAAIPVFYMLLGRQFKRDIVTR